MNKYRLNNIHFLMFLAFVSCQSQEANQYMNEVEKMNDWYKDAISQQINDEDKPAEPKPSLEPTPSLTPTPTNSILPPPPSDLEAGLIGFYPFNFNLTDESGSGNHAYINFNTGATEPEFTIDRFGNFNSAKTFNGNKDKITIPINISPDILPHISIAMWVKTTKNRGEKTGLDEETVLFSQDNGGEDRELMLRYFSGPNGGDASWYAPIGGGQPFGPLPTRFEEWDFIVVMFDAINSSLQIHINELEPASNFTNFDSQINNSRGGTTEFTIGGQPVFIDINHFTGSIDDVRVYNRLLSTEEISLLFSRTF